MIVTTQPSMRDPNTTAQPPLVVTIILGLCVALLLALIPATLRERHRKRQRQYE